MPAILGSVQRWFQPAQPAKADWHAYIEGDTTAFCHAVALRYNIDSIADEIPPDGRACPRCLDRVSKLPAPPRQSETAETTGSLSVHAVIERGRWSR